MSFPSLWKSLLCLAGWFHYCRPNGGHLKGRLFFLVKVWKCMSFRNLFSRGLVGRVLLFITAAISACLGAFNVLLLCHNIFTNIIRVKVFLPPLFHTRETLQLGSSCPLTRLLSKLSSTPERVWLLLKLVLSWEMLTVFPKLRLSPVTRSWESWSPTVWLQRSQKTCTSWSRRLSLSESTWRETERTRTLSSDWFWSNPESTDWPDTTEPFLSCHQTGSTSPPPLLLWLTKLFAQFNSYSNIIYLCIFLNTFIVILRIHVG